MAMNKRKYLTKLLLMLFENKAYEAGLTQKQAAELAGLYQEQEQWSASFRATRRRNTFLVLKNCDNSLAIILTNG